MKEAFLARILIIALLAFSQISCTQADFLMSGFQSPPDSARPGVYWYFMDGHISKEGITKDLEAMKAAGIGYVLFMEVNVWIPRGKTDFLSDEWLDCFVYAEKECRRLGIGMSLGTGPGWAGSGGPWVKPEQSMQHLVGSEVEVAGNGKLQTIDLPLPPPREPYFGMAEELHKDWAEYYQDVAVLAFPSGVSKFGQESNGAKYYSTVTDLDDRALYYRQPYTSQSDVRAFLPVLANYDTSGTALNPQQIIDLTDSLQENGALKWAVPDGKWTVMRFVARNNGMMTRPAPTPGLGFEADKMDTAAIRAHLEHYPGKLIDKIGLKRGIAGRARNDVAEQGGLQTLHIDSWEMGAQNWTPHFREEFISRKGYDPVPFYPVYSGKTVGSREISERFLWDLRNVTQQLILENHVDYIKKYAHSQGLQLSIEPYDMNPTSDITLGVAGDIPSCEFWSIGEGFNTAYSVFEATSAAHIIGQPLVLAEAFTAQFDGWRQHPQSMKNIGDWAFAAGVNRFMIHTFAHQALADSLKPGMTMGPYGVHWDRNQTWWGMSGAYHRYIARCQFMLQQGRTVADILYLTPEGNPLVFMPPKSAVTYLETDSLNKDNFRRESPVPDRRGYNFDGCTPELLYAAKVDKNGNIAFPNGGIYKILVLPAVETMTPQLLHKIKDLADAGATIAGLPPQKSPSLQNYPDCDAEVARLIKEIWNGKIITFDKQRLDGLYPDYEFAAEILDNKGFTEDFQTPSDALRYTHRTSGDDEIYFVSNRKNEFVKTKVTFRVAGKKPELWNPQTGETVKLSNFTKLGTSQTCIELQFEPYESYFIVFRRKNTQHLTLNTQHSTLQSFASIDTLKSAWTVKFDTIAATFPTLTDWTENENPYIKYFSGTAVYKTKFKIDDKKSEIKDGKLFLQFDKINNMARITLNGKELGVLWTPPFRVEITDALIDGENELKIEIANLWINRIIGDLRNNEHYTSVTWQHYSKESPLQASGLTGNVIINKIYTHEK